MAGIKAGLCALVVAMSMLSGGLMAADGTQNVSVKNSAQITNGFMGGKSANPEGNFVIGGLTPEPAAATCSKKDTLLELSLCMCAKTKVAIGLTDCITMLMGDWDLP